VIEIQIDTNECWDHNTTIHQVFKYVESHGGRKMPLGAIRTVYTVANDMDLMQAFYAGALELPLAFRDRDNWCSSKPGRSRLR
jgi:hypothetical protein